MAFMESIKGQNDDPKVITGEVDQSAEDYKLMLNQLSEKAEAKANNPVSTKGNEESPFDKAQRIGKEKSKGQKRWLELSQSDVYAHVISNNGKVHTIFDFVREEVDNQRFLAKKKPFFGDRYLWKQDDKFPWGDPKCQTGIGHYELYNSMVKAGELDNLFSSDDFSETLWDEFQILEKTNFQGHQS